MVQGVSKQVIVVQAADTDEFEQAIFILKEDAVKNGGITQAALLRQARQAVSERKIRCNLSVVHCLFAGVIGAAAASAIWLVSYIL